MKTIDHGKLCCAMIPAKGGPPFRAFIHRTTGKIAFCYNADVAEYFFGQDIPDEYRANRIAIAANQHDWDEIPEMDTTAPTADAKMIAYVKSINAEFEMDIPKKVSQCRPASRSTKVPRSRSATCPRK